MLKYFVEIDITTLIVIAAVILTFALQLLLCFKTKRSLVRMAPLAVCIVLAIVFSTLSACTGGWDGMGYLFFAMLFAALTFVSGLGWGLWTVIRARHP